MSKKEFYIRLVLYLGLTYITPIALIINFYGVLKGNTLSFTGLLVVAIVMLMFLKLGKAFKEALWYKFYVQAILALASSMWILVLFFGAQLIGENIETVKTICLYSFGAIVVGKIFNPFPKWTDLRKKQELLDYAKQN